MKRFISTLLAIILLFSAMNLCVNAKDRPFIDTVDGAWYEKSLTYCYEHGYMKGMSHGYFSPEGKLTRAMAVQIFYAINSDSTSFTSTSFTDVSRNAWYYKAVEWAYSMGIVKGTGEGRFSPNANVTRQDFFVILYNYSSVFSHYDTEEITDSYLWFDDNDNIADYADDAMNWAVCHKILSGYANNTVKPRKYITRAEITSIIQRFDKVLGHKWLLNGSITERSCTSDGYASYICQDCPAVKKVTYDKGHIRYFSGTTTGTCISRGTRIYNCINCNVVKSEPTVYGDHSFDLTSVLKPTRTKGGYSTYKCVYCGKEELRDYTSALGRTEGWDSNYDGKLTIDEYLGAYDMAEFLAAHKNDYVGTPYKRLADYLNEPWMLIRDKGQYPKNPGMNCTGFIAGVVARSGGNLNKITNRSKGSYINAYNWLLTVNTNGIYHYTFYSIDAALNSGLMEKGDILLFLPTPKDNDPDDGLDPDFHFGFFWGDTPYHNLFWHSTGATKYNRDAGVRGMKNQITKIGSGTPYSAIWVFPMQDE